MNYVLDADVLIGALDSSDAHHAQARALFNTWRTEGDSRIVSAINLTEVLVAPSRDPHRLRVARTAITALGVSTHSPSELIAVDAARLRGRHPISVPDSYALATTRHAGGAVASFDARLLKAAAAEGIATI